MKQIRLTKLSCSLLLLILPFYIQAQLVMNYQIMANSKLYLTGKSNVNKFSCDCIESFPLADFQISQNSNSNLIYFSNTKIDIPTSKLDCGNKKMNKDLKKTLLSDQYPNINIELCEVSIPSDELENDWNEVTANTYMVLAGNRKAVQMKIKSIKSSPNQYRLKCTQVVRLTDFDIDPPTALLGLVKVKDEISIHFDLIVKVDTKGMGLLRKHK